MSRVGRAVCFTAGSVLALLLARLVWGLLWAAAVEQAYGKRWEEET